MGPFHWQQAENRGTVQIILAGAKQSSRFVQRDIDLAANLDEAAVNGNPVMGGINLSTKLIRGPAIDRDFAGKYELFRGPPRGDACFGQKFLKSDHETRKRSSDSSRRERRDAGTEPYLLKA